ncbi:MAG TPA: erythromycin esterase family protein [Casimicrobiaceae bacterium]|nr:erythromycin esterase family protein [Casimicrobiaceae bacterium]
MAVRQEARDEREARVALEAVKRHAHAMTGTLDDYAPIVDLAGTARFALIGEASHGTHEFYHARAEITKRLIVEHGYTAIAVEADWPDAYRVNRYVRGASDDADANAALSGFKRFPAWMWRNTVVLDFVEWLRQYNQSQPAPRRVGFYGVDLYSLFSSMQAVLDYLDKTDPEAAQRARYRYSCFDHFGEDTQAYGYAAAFGMSSTCEEAVVKQLVELTRRAGQAAKTDGRGEPDELFYAEQNARLVKNAEEYYRTMFKGRVSSWNLRDRHMVETLDALDRHLGQHGAAPRIAVWAHNSHLGDASATEMGDGGEWNVGELVRAAQQRAAVLIGFSTYRGTVTAASDWGGHAERKQVRPGLPDSYEELFHRAGHEQFLMVLRDNAQLSAALEPPRLQRAIGVIYLPESERVSHYFHVRLPRQFDAMIHLDHTRALRPLEPGSGWVEHEAPETFPTGI